MFTVRVDNGPSPVSTRTVYECASYTVRTDQFRAVSLILAAKGGEEQPIRLPLGSIVYVMNAQGVTVDVIRTSLPARKTDVDREAEDQIRSGTAV
jgi:hypothetical protein